MKKISLMMWQGLLLSALALGFVACEPSDKPCPNKKEADGDTSQGVTVMLEMENVVTGETTRTALGEKDYNFTPYEAGANGDVQAKNLGFKKKLDGRNDINVALTYYAKENVVFQGWSWRYSEDPVGTHRGKDDAKINDYVATPALQSERGVQKLNLSDDDTKFTCQYRPGTDNRVYVKVRYVNVPSDFPRNPYCPALYLFDVDKTLGTLGIGVGDKYTVNGQIQASNLFVDLLNACEEYLAREYRGSLASTPQSTNNFLSEFQRNVPTIDQDLLEIRDGYYHQLLTYRPRSPYVGYDKMALAKIEELQFLSPYLRTESNFRHETVTFLTRVQNSLSKSGSRGSFNVGTHRVDRAKFAQLVAVYMNEVIDMESRLTNILKGNGIVRNDNFDYDYVKP